MVRLSKIRIDPALESEGRWCTYEGTIEVKLARAGNPSYDRRFRELTEPWMRQIREGALDEDIQERIQKQAMAETIVKGWRGMTEDEGLEMPAHSKLPKKDRDLYMLEDDDLYHKQIPFTPKRCLEYFEDPELRDFWKWCNVSSQQKDAYARKLQEEREGN